MSVEVKQHRTNSVDEAVAATLELESHSQTGPGRIPHVSSEEAAVVGTVRDGDRDDKLMVKLSDLIERIERLEAETDSQSAGIGFWSGHRILSE